MLKVKVEDPNAFRFILQDELYLLDEDKSYYNSPPIIRHEIETPKPNFNYLGLNKKKLLILVSYSGHEFIQDEHLAALESVLGRKGFTRDDAAILNMAKTGTNYEDLASYFGPEILILLGKESIPAGFEPPAFNAVGILHGHKLLYTFSFDEMMSNNDNKKVFWEQMKTL